MKNDLPENATIYLTIEKREAGHRDADSFPYSTTASKPLVHRVRATAANIARSTEPGERYVMGGQPKGAEALAEGWLCRVCNRLAYVGDGEGPPDFLIEYGGVEVAVEVMRMLDGDGWPRHKRIGFERTLAAVVRSVREEAGVPRWHVFCEYDPRERRPPPPRGPWMDLVRDTLRTPGPGGTIQLIPYDKRVGRGVVVEYVPAGNDGSFSGVSEDIGIWVVGTALSQIGTCVAEKAGKVSRGKRAKRFSHWWLVLVEEVIIDHEGLGAEWAAVEDGVRDCAGIGAWNKVVLLSRYSGEATVVYERSGGLALGRRTL